MAKDVRMRPGAFSRAVLPVDQPGKVVVTKEGIDFLVCAMSRKSADHIL